VIVKSKSLPYNKWKAILQPFAHDADNEPYRNYTGMTIGKLVGFFGRRFPSWIQDELTDDDKELAKTEFDKLVKATDVSVRYSGHYYSC
jgi:hypothetical protein